MNKISDSIKNATGSAKAKASQTGAAARQKASDAYDKGKDAASRGVQSSKDLANKAKAKSSDTIDKNPLAIVAGGLALGAIIGALLPKSDREKKILGPTGKKLNDKAKKVASAAREAGMDKVEDLGINKDSAREQFRDLVSKASEAVKAAGKAAGDAARKQD